MIAHWPKGIKLPDGSINTSFCHVIDIMATCLDLTGATYPDKYNGYDIQPYMGISMKPIFETGDRTTDRDLCFEHFNEKALIDAQGWKIVQPANGNEWELYDLNNDRSEMHNLASIYPDRVKDVVKRYLEWEKNCKVVPRPK